MTAANVRLWRGIVDCVSFHVPKDGFSHFKICVSLQTRLQICSGPTYYHGVQHRPERPTRGLYTGIIAIVFGIALALLTYLGVIPATLGWLAVAGSIFGGAFAIFEARKGCIVRAVESRRSVIPPLTSNITTSDPEPWPIRCRFRTILSMLQTDHDIRLTPLSKMNTETLRQECERQGIPLEKVQPTSLENVCYREYRRARPPRKRTTRYARGSL